MLSIHSSQKPEQESTFPEPSSSIQNQLLSMKLELEPTDNFSIQNNSSPERKMLLTTLPEVTTPSERKSSTYASTESESLLTSALVSKVSLYSTLLVVVLDQVLDLSSLKDSQSITERSPSSDSLFTHPLRFQLLLLSHTTLCSLPTPSWNTLMQLLCSTMRLSTISAEETWILKDPPTPT